MQKETELSAALTQLSDEDPFLFYERNPLTGQMYLRVMGMVQIEILEELLQSSFGLETSFFPPSVIYKEKPAHEAVGKELLYDAETLLGRCGTEGRTASCGKRDCI